MDNHTRISILGETAADLYFIENGYDVFRAIGDKSHFDRVVYLDGALYKVEIKTTSRRNKNDTGWVVEIRKIRSNKRQNKIYNFDKNSCDILAIYIEPLKRIVILKSSSIMVESAITILDKDLHGGMA